MGPKVGFSRATKGSARPAPTHRRSTPTRAGRAVRVAISANRRPLEGRIADGHVAPGSVYSPPKVSSPAGHGASPSPRARRPYAGCVAVRVPRRDRGTPMALNVELRAAGGSAPFHIAQDDVSYPREQTVTRKSTVVWGRAKTRPKTAWQGGPTATRARLGQTQALAQRNLGAVAGPWRRGAPQKQRGAPQSACQNLPSRRVQELYKRF